MLFEQYDLDAFFDTVRNNFRFQGSADPHIVGIVPIDVNTRYKCIVCRRDSRQGPGDLVSHKLGMVSEEECRCEIFLDHYLAVDHEWVSDVVIQIIEVVSHRVVVIEEPRRTLGSWLDGFSTGKTRYGYQQIDPYSDRFRKLEAFVHEMYQQSDEQKQQQQRQEKQLERARQQEADQRALRHQHDFWNRFGSKK